MDSTKQIAEGEKNMQEIEKGDVMGDEKSTTDWKEAINNLLWMLAPCEMTMGQAEELSAEIFQTIEKHLVHIGKRMREG